VLRQRVRARIRVVAGGVRDRASGVLGRHSSCTASPLEVCWREGNERTSGGARRPRHRNSWRPADKQFVRRGAKARFTEPDDVVKSLTADRRKKAKTKVKSGRGDQGDR
jgi:hypothetical protein